MDSESLLSTAAVSECLSPTRMITLQLYKQVEAVFINCHRVGLCETLSCFVLQSPILYRYLQWTRRRGLNLAGWARPMDGNRGRADSSSAALCRSAHQSAPTRVCRNKSSRCGCGRVECTIVCIRSSNRGGFRSHRFPVKP